MPTYELRDSVVEGLQAIDYLTRDEMTEALPGGASDVELERTREPLQESDDVVVRRGKSVRVDRLSRSR